MKNLELLITDVMAMLLLGEDETHTKLRNQLENSSIVKTELTGAGFFVTLKVASDEHCLSDKSVFKIGNVAADIDGLKYGAGFLLYIENGYLQMLEGYSFEEPWPDEIKNYQLRHVEE